MSSVDHVSPRDAAAFVMRWLEARGGRFQIMSDGGFDADLTAVDPATIAMPPHVVGALAPHLAEEIRIHLRAEQITQ